MSKRVTTDDLENIRSNSFSTAYHDLVRDPDDWPGMIAYCHYKEDIAQRCARFVGDIDDLRKDLISRKDLTPHDIEMLRRTASLRVEAYAQEAVDVARPAIERDTLSAEVARANEKLAKDVDHLFAKVRALPDQLKKGRLRQFFLGVAASFVAYIVVLAVPDFFGWFAERDAGTQIQELRADVRHLTQAIEQRHDNRFAALEPAVAEHASGSPEAMIESALPAVPEVFREQTMREESVEHLEQRVKVWRKANHTGEVNENNGFRKDVCGTWIKFDDFEDRGSEFGWTIGLLLPSFPRGNESANDLQPLHWQNTVNSDRSWRCSVESEGDANVTKMP